MKFLEMNFNFVSSHPWFETTILYPMSYRVGLAFVSPYSSRDLKVSWQSHLVSPQHTDTHYINWIPLLRRNTTLCHTSIQQSSPETKLFLLSKQKSALFVSSLCINDQLPTFLSSHSRFIEKSVLFSKQNDHCTFNFLLGLIFQSSIFFAVTFKFSWIWNTLQSSNK